MEQKAYGLDRVAQGLIRGRGGGRAAGQIRHDDAIGAGLAVDEGNIERHSGFSSSKRRAQSLYCASVRRTGEEDDREYELKPLVAVQRVRRPPGKGQPASRKRALRVSGNTKREA